MTTIWGSSFFFTAFALQSFGPLLIVMARIAMAAVILAVVVAVARPPMPSARAEWLHLIWLGLFNIAVPFAILTVAQQHVISSTTVVLSATTPLFVFLLAIATRAERFDPRRLVGILLCLAGVTVLTLYGGAAGAETWFWPLVIVGTSAIYAAGNVYTRRYLRDVSSLSTAWLQMTFGALWMLPAMWLFDGWRIGPIVPMAVAAILELGVLGSALCYVLFFYFIRTWGSTATSLNTYLQPVVGVLLGVLILQERATPGAGIGLGLVGLGIAGFAWGALRPSRQALSRPPGSAATRFADRPPGSDPRRPG